MVPKMVFTTYAATTGARCIDAANGSEGEGEKGCRLPLPGAHNVPRGVFRPVIASGETAKWIYLHALGILALYVSVAKATDFGPSPVSLHRL